MYNNEAVFISRFAPLGLYKRIHIDKSSIVEQMTGKDQDEPVITFKYNDGKNCEIKLLEYSNEGQDLLRKMLHLKK